MKVLLVVGLVGLALSGCASDTATDAAAEGVTRIEARDFVFVPDEVELEAGEVTFSIPNTGNEVHEFEVFEGEKLLDEVEDITPGLTRDLTMTLEPGTYEYACKFEDHYERGMKGTLTVTEP